MVIVRFKDTKEQVATFPTKADFDAAFPNGFDEDNSKIFEFIIIE